MISNSFTIRSGNGTKIFCKSIVPKDSPKALLFMVHGLGEHMGRYDSMANSFVENRIAVFAFDHRGHGNSEGKRGHAIGLEQLVDDLEYALMKCRNMFLDIPIFIYGHSMGGQIVASYLDKMKSKEIEGAIISSAWFRLATAPSSWQLKTINLISSVLPSITVGSKLDPSYISSVQNEVELYQKDPLVHDKISLGLFNSLYKNGLHLLQQAQKVNIPVLVCHGDKDKITSPEGSQQYATRIGGKAKLQIWKGAFHEAHHDFDKDKVIKYYVDWVLDKL